MIIYLDGHGEYAKGVYNTLKFFKADLDNVFYMDFSNHFEEEMEEFIIEHQDDDLIIITDLLCGSVNQCAMRLLKKYHYRLFSGVNIAFLLEIIFRESISDDELNEILDEAKNNLLFINPLMENFKK